MSQYSYEKTAPRGVLQVNTCMIIIALSCFSTHKSRLGEVRTLSLSGLFLNIMSMGLGQTPLSQPLKQELSVMIGNKYSSGTSTDLT